MNAVVWHFCRREANHWPSGDTLREAGACASNFMMCGCRAHARGRSNALIRCALHQRLTGRFFSALVPGAPPWWPVTRVPRLGGPTLPSSSSACRTSRRSSAAPSRRPVRAQGVELSARWLHGERAHDTPWSPRGRLCYERERVVRDIVSSARFQAGFGGFGARLSLVRPDVSVSDRVLGGSLEYGSCPCRHKLVW